MLQKKYLELNSINVNTYQINNYENLKKNSFLISNHAYGEIKQSFREEYTEKILNKYINYGFLIWGETKANPIYKFINNKTFIIEPEQPMTDGGGRNKHIYIKPN